METRKIMSHAMTYIFEIWFACAALMLAVSQQESLVPANETAGKNTSKRRLIV